MEPLGTTNFLPCPCWDPRTVGEKQLFQQRRLIQCLKQVCRSICSLGAWDEAPAVFCQKQSVEKMLGRWQHQVIILTYLNPSRSTPTHTTSSQIWQCFWIWTTSKRDKCTPQKTRKPSSISPYEVLQEICLLQVEPLGTTNFLPRPCWDLIAEGKIQVFQLCRLAQGFKQICGSICSLRVSVEAPAVLCQNQSGRKDVGTRTKFMNVPDHLKPVSVNSNSYDKFTNLTMLLNLNNFQERQMHAAENKKTLKHFSLRGTPRNMPSSSGATWHYEFFATPLLGSDCRRKDPSFPAVSTGSRLQANLRVHLLLACLCRSTCSALSESISVGKATSPRTFHLKPIQVNSNSYTTTSQIWQSFWIQTVSNRDRGTLWNLPSASSATWHHAVFATLLAGSHNRSEDPRIPSCSIAKSWRNPRHHVLCHVLQKRCGSNNRGRRLEGARDTSSPRGIGQWLEWGCRRRP